MTAVVFIHGAGDVGWYWHLVAAELRERYDDDIALFDQDVPPALAAEALKRGRRQSEVQMGNRRHYGPGPTCPRAS